VTLNLPVATHEGSNGLHLDVITLPISIRVDDAARSVQIIGIRNPQEARFLSWKLLLVPSTQNEVVEQTSRMIKEILAMKNHPRRIYTDNGSSFKGLAELLQDSTTSQDSPIEVIAKAPGRPYSKGSLERSLTLISDGLKNLPGYVDPHQDSTKQPPVEHLLTLGELEERMTRFIVSWNSAQNGSGE
jgi:hypothetical protein